eukprot:TCONS_00035211-protein
MASNEKDWKSKPSEEVLKLKKLLLREEERKRTNLLQSISERSQELSNINVPTTSTLEPLLSNQSSVEYQLQQQVQFYQDALSSLQTRSNHIAEENAKLYERMRESILKEPQFSSSDEGTESTQEEKSSTLSDGEEVAPYKQNTKTTKKERLMKTKQELRLEKSKKHQHDEIEELSLLGDEMEKLKELQDAKTQHLESLLHTARRQVDEKEKIISNLKSEMNYYKMPVKEDPNSVVNLPMTKSLPNSIPGTKLVQRLTRECQDLAESLEKQQKQVEAGNQREVVAYEQVKKSCDLVEQVQLEKQELMVQVLQLKKDLAEYKEKYADMQKKHEEHQAMFNKRSKDKLQSSNKELSQKVEEQALKLAGLQNELEKVTRSKVELKRELDQHQLKILCQETETNALMDETRRDTLEVMKSKSLLEQEMNQVRLDCRSKEKKKQQEIEHLKIELNETKRRLQSTEESVNELQNDILQQTNNSNTIEQKFHREQIQRQLDQSSYEEQKRRMVLESGKREQELLQLIQLNEERAAQSQDELSQIMENQAEIVQRFKEECLTLKDKLISEKQLRGQKVSELQSKSKRFLGTIQELKMINSQKDKQITERNEQLCIFQEECADYKDQVIALMNKQNIILRDRNLLTKEIEMLKSQLKSFKFETP